MIPVEGCSGGSPLRAREPFETVRKLVRPGAASANPYHSDPCDRTFEVDAPPDRVICSDGRNEDVQRLDA